jgi:predicted secreted protein
MALTKLPKNAIADGAVDASKIEDGTIQNQEISGTIPADKLNSTQDLSSKTVTLPNTSVTNDMLSGSIASAKLSNSSITINGNSVSLGGSATVGIEVNWQSVITGAGSSSTAVAGNGYFIDTTSNTHTLNLPASATLGDQIAIKDYAGTFASNNLTIGRNGHNIQGVANDSLISTNRASLLLVYVDSTKGWIYAEESNVASLVAPTFTEATGGTITESGDFKIHTFTGDGCFVVTAGNAPIFPGNPQAGPNALEYLVIAGGGGGNGSSGGGGGAGGFRTNYPSPGITISNGTYPVTVGAGGPSTTPQGGQGSNSIFSTITSTGGGGGSGPGETGGSGGSGGGGGNSKGPYPSPTQVLYTPGGSGNTPPVSPSQGNNGSQGGWPGQQGGGGGGAGGTGTGAPGSYPAPNGPRVGGPGASNSITGSSVTYAGGGGAGGNFGYQGGPAVGGPTSPAEIRTGGSGGGGDGGGGPSEPNPSFFSGKAGTANLGGGGGGRGGAGGKGVVILRYKFQ